MNLTTVLINAYLVTALMQWASSMMKPPVLRARYHPVLVALAWPIQVTFGNIIPLFWFLGAALVGYLIIS